MKQYGSRITEYERREIEAYPDIYYLGMDAHKIHGEEGAQLNGGFDDENGSYNKVIIIIIIIILILRYLYK